LNRHPKSLSLFDLREPLTGLLVLAALWITPLVLLPIVYDQFMLPKTAWIKALSVGLLLIAALGSMRDRPLRLPLHAVQIWGLLFLAWNLLRFPLAVSPSLAWDKCVWLAAVLVLAWRWQEWARGGRGRVLLAAWGLAVVAGITAAWVVLQDIQVQWHDSLPHWLRGGRGVVNKLGDWRGFLTAGFGNSDFIAMWLAALYLPVLLLALHCRRAWQSALLLLVLWLCAAALVLCWSVGNNASLMLGFGVLLVLTGRKRLAQIWRKRWRLLLAWVGGCAVVVLWLTTNTPLNPHRATPQPDGEKPSLPGIFAEAFDSDRWAEGGPTRAIIYLNTLEMIRKNQLLGVGPGCFTHAYPEARTAFMPNDPNWLRYQGNFTNAAHNCLLQTWAELGPIGAFLLAALVFSALRRLFAKSRVPSRTKAASRDFVGEWLALGAGASLTVLCLTSLMSFPLELPSSTLLFFCLAPMGFILSERDRAREYQTPPLVMEGSWTDLSIELEDMRRPKSVALSLRLSPGICRLVAALLVVLACFCWFRISLPLVADYYYFRARSLDDSRMRPLSDTNSMHGRRLAVEGVYSAGAGNMRDFVRATAGHRAELKSLDSARLYRRALAIWPRHSDCRSRYSEFLLLTGQYEECLDHMEILFRRLNSSELYLRRGLARFALDRPGEAQSDFQTFVQRLPILTYAPDIEAQEP
jgi:O-antigen ligase